MDEEAIYKVLQFHGLGSREIDPRTESVEGGLAVDMAARVSDAQILASETLRKAIREYYDSKVVRRTFWSVVGSEIVEFEEMAIIARQGDRAELEITYLWQRTGRPSSTGNDRAEVLIEIIPNVSNEIYERERYGQPLVIEDSYFPDIAREIADLGLAVGRDDRECVHNYHSPNPCVESIPLFERFAAQHGLPLDADAAYMFQAYVRGEYGRADRLYARAKGYVLPKYEGIGTEVAALVLEVYATHSQESAHKQGDCQFNYYDANPCRGVIPVWRAFASRHGLGLSRLSADLFQAYADGTYRRGDRLYRIAKGIAAPDYTGPGVAVVDRRGILTPLVG